MRILFTSRGSSGHVLPMVGPARACRDAGHDVLFAVQGQHAGNVQRTGLPYATLPDPPREEWMPRLAAFAQMGIDEANDAMLRDFFADIDLRATLPAMLDLVADWRPDVVVRESWEFASIVAAEVAGVPVVRVGLGLAAVEELTDRLVAGRVEAVRAAAGLAPDPSGACLRGALHVTAVPEALDGDGDGDRRLRVGTATSVRRPDLLLPDWWDGDAAAPLVYVTLGTVAGGPGGMRYFPDLYRAAADALAPLPIRILMTVGDDADPAALGALPANVHVERWVAQDDVLAHAAAVVGHGGYGTTLGALAHGVPLVVLPLFSVDQWANAAAVQAAGAGIALDAERATRPVLGLPGAAALAALAPAVSRVLGEPAFAEAAQAIGREMAALPPVATVADAVAGLAVAQAGR